MRTIWRLLQLSLARHLWQGIPCTKDQPLASLVMDSCKVPAVEVWTEAVVVVMGDSTRPLGNQLGLGACQSLLKGTIQATTPHQAVSRPRVADRLFPSCSLACLHLSSVLVLVLASGAPPGEGVDRLGRCKEAAGSD